jgi:hypothetical protein
LRASIVAAVGENGALFDKARFDKAGSPS